MSGEISAGAAAAGAASYVAAANAASVQSQGWGPSYLNDLDGDLDQVKADLQKFEQQVASLQNPSPQEIQQLGIFSQLKTDIASLGTTIGEMQDSTNPIDEAVVSSTLFGQVSGFFNNASIQGISFGSIATEENAGFDKTATTDLADYLSVMLNQSGLNDLATFMGDITSFRDKH